MATEPDKEDNYENVKQCTSSGFADELAYPKEGGVLVIEGTRVPDLLDNLALTPEDDDARAEHFKSLGATYYQRVSDYSDTLTEQGTTMDDSQQEDLEEEEESGGKRESMRE